MSFFSDEKECKAGNGERGVVCTHSWKLWYDEGSPRGQKVEDYQREAIELQSFPSFKEYEVFWQQRLDTDKPISAIVLPEFSNIRLFKPDIKPTWEDPSNDGGGKLVIRVREPPPEPAGRLWQLLLQAAWGGTYTTWIMCVGWCSR